MAFELARKRRKKVTSVDKSNVLENSQLWRGWWSKSPPSIPTSRSIICWSTTAPCSCPESARFDVVLTENMFGDILSDEGAVLAGSIGMLPSASIGAKKAVRRVGGPVRAGARFGARHRRPEQSQPLRRHRIGGGLLEYSFGLKEEAAAVNRAMESRAEQRTRDGGPLKPRRPPPPPRKKAQETGSQFVRQIYENMPPRTIIEKVWDSHVVHEEARRARALYIDLHLVHEVTSPQAFQGLRERGLKVRRPDLTIATTDHSIPTTDRARCPSSTRSPPSRWRSSKPTAAISASAAIGSAQPDRQGIVHVIGPELGLTQPGMTVVCGDSHTATHGAFGALAFGIGTSEVEHVLATQCLLQRRRKLPGAGGRHAETGRHRQGHHPGADRAIGIGGGTGCVFEYTGSAIRALDPWKSA
jgi:hypothetical protein